MILNSFSKHRLVNVVPSSYDWRFYFDKGEITISCPWRVLKKGKKYIASGDHGQIYGLPKHIDAAQKVLDLLCNKKIKKLKISSKTGDIEIIFNGDIVLQTFNFFSYEPWTLTAPDGAYLVFNDRINMWPPPPLL